MPLPDCQDVFVSEYACFPEMYPACDETQLTTPCMPVVEAAWLIVNGDDPARCCQTMMGSDRLAWATGFLSPVFSAWLMMQRAS